MICEDVCGTTVLQSAVSEVFETMVFMEVEPKEVSEPFLAGDPWVMSSVAFRGNFDGVLTLVCSRDCARTVAMNMLALDDLNELDESDVADTLGEITNMTMGTLKSNLYDVVGELAVSVPMVVSGTNVTSQLGEADRKICARVRIGREFDLDMTLIYKD